MEMYGDHAIGLNGDVWLPCYRFKLDMLTDPAKGLKIGMCGDPVCSPCMGLVLDLNNLVCSCFKACLLWS